MGKSNTERIRGMGSGVGTDEAAVLTSTAAAGSTEKVIFEQKPQGAGVNPPDTREQHPKQTEGKASVKSLQQDHA